jgi:hypothetical protein
MMGIGDMFKQRQRLEWWNIHHRLEGLRTKPLVRVYHWPCGLKKMPLIRGLYLVQLTLTSEGLSDVPLVGRLCHVQRTLTTKGLNDLPLV